MPTPYQDDMLLPFKIVLINTFNEQVGETFDARFSQDGNILLSSDGTAVYIWKLTLKKEWELYKRISCFAVAPRFAPDGRMFVYRDKERTLHLSSLEGIELATLPLQASGDSAFSPDQHWLVSGDVHGQLIIWDLSSYQHHSIQHQLTFQVPWKSAQWTPLFLHHLQERISSANHILFTPNGQKLVFVSASDKGYVHICQFDYIKQQLFLQKTIGLIGIYDQKVAPDGKLIAITSEDDVHIYDLESFQQVARFVGTRDAGYTLLAFSPDSQFLASSTLDGNVDIWSLRTFEHIISFAAHPGLATDWAAAIGGLDWSHNGYIATGGSSLFKNDINRSDYTIKIWKVEQ